MGHGNAWKRADNAFVLRSSARARLRSLWIHVFWMALEIARFSWSPLSILIPTPLVEARREGLPDYMG